MLAAVCAGVLAGTVTAPGSAHAQTTTGYCAILPDTIGLYEGNLATQMGAQIGRIDTITPVEDGVRVDFSVATGRPLPATVKAVSRSNSILADRSLELVGNYESGPKLQPGQCISVDNSYTPKSISEITGSVADLIDRISPQGEQQQHVAGALRGAAESISGTGPQMATLVKTASAAASSPEKLVSDLGQIIQTMTPLTGKVLDQWSDIEHIIRMVPDGGRAAANVWFPGVQRMIKGCWAVIPMAADLQFKYGDLIWPAADKLADAIHVAALNVGKVQGALNALPSVAGLLTVVSKPGAGAGVRVRPPSVRVRAADARRVCALLNGGSGTRCVPSGAGTVTIGYTDLLALGGIR